ncbi:MAG: hypothetical protein ACKVOE_10965 [Rickettsiales bacterium]
MSQPQPVQPNHGNIIRSNLAGNGDTTFVDYDNLHPTNETAAAVSGAAAGATTGALIVGLAAMVGADSPKPYYKKILTAPGLMISAAIIAIPAAIGAYTSTLRARTHNQWSSRVLDHLQQKPTDHIER